MIFEPWQIGALFWVVGLGLWWANYRLGRTVDRLIKECGEMLEEIERKTARATAERE